MFFISTLVLLFILKTWFPSNRPLSDVLFASNIIMEYYMLLLAQHNPFKKMQWLYFGFVCTTRCQNIWETSKVLKLKNSNLSSANFLYSFRMSPKCPTMTKQQEQQHPRPAHSSEGSGNLPKWWSPRLGHGAVLAASKPLQVSKYPSIQVSIEKYMNLGII